MTPDDRLLEPAPGDAPVDPAAGLIEQAAPVPPPAPPEECWRCGKLTPAGDACIWCGARGASTPLAIQAAAPQRSAIPRLIGAFAVLLISAAVIGVVGGALAVAEPEKAERQSLFEFTALDVVLLAIWTVVAAISIVSVGRPPPLAAPRRGVRIAATVLALPILAGLLALNMGYHRLLLDYVNLSWVELPTIEPPAPLAIGYAVVAVCLLPGVVEELFFRYLALGTLRSAMSDRAAVLVSSIMFGIAHVHAPLSIPMLTVVGLGLGAVRLLTGSLLIPIALHALHNGAVLYLEYQQWSAS